MQIKFYIFTALLLASMATAGQSLRSVPNDAFQSGEYLKYRVYYDSWFTSWITAGYGTMTVNESSEKFNDRPVYHIKIIGQSTKFFNMIMKVDDRFESLIDKESLLPRKFIRRTREGSYVKDDDVYFDYKKMTATTQKKVLPIPDDLQDMVSAFYYMRTIDFDTAVAGDEYQIKFYLDDTVYNSKIIFLGRENVEIKLGVFPCLKFKPQVAKGEVFTDPYPMLLWVTDDKNKIPILGKSAVYVGSVTMELLEHSGLRHPLKRLAD